MFVKTHGIVLRTVKYGDDSLIIDLLTREEGRVSAVVRTGSSQKSRMRRRLFQPLAVLDVDARPAAPCRALPTPALP